MTAGTRGFVVASVGTGLVAALVAWAPGVLGRSADEATSVSPVLRQVEQAPTTDPTGDPVDDGTTTGDVAGEEVVDTGSLVDTLVSQGETESLEVYLSRDPFQPVVVQASTGDGGGSDGSGEGSGDDSGGDAGSGDGSTGGADDGSTCTGGGEEAVCEGVVVTMTGFTSDGEALVEVDGVLHTVATGESFATSFRVERLDESSGCAFLRYGDEAFTICTGATVLK